MQEILCLFVEYDQRHSSEPIGFVTTVALRIGRSNEFIIDVECATFELSIFQFALLVLRIHETLLNFIVLVRDSGFRDRDRETGGDSNRQKDKEKCKERDRKGDRDTAKRQGKRQRDSEREAGQERRVDF